MSNEVIRYGRAALSKSDEKISRDVGKSLMIASASGLTFWTVAGLIPFITFPMLLIAAVLLGEYLYIK